jgi:hypothetical protein
MNAIAIVVIVNMPLMQVFFESNVLIFVFQPIHPLGIKNILHSGRNEAVHTANRDCGDNNQSRRGMNETDGPKHD